VGARILIIDDQPREPRTDEVPAWRLRAHRPCRRGGPAGAGSRTPRAPDLIVCDVQLPDMDGYEVARWLKSDPELRTVPWWQ